MKSRQKKRILADSASGGSLSESRPGAGETSGEAGQVEIVDSGASDPEEDFLDARQAELEEMGEEESLSG
ncbi:MAG: hypothetical protein HDQ91_07500, partial [Desulfovibrio sp.]|nr:hypothetical protein [Desulfovibrio sp.]